MATETIELTDDDGDGVSAEGGDLVLSLRPASRHAVHFSERSPDDRAKVRAFGEALVRWADTGRLTP